MARLSVAAAGMPGPSVWLLIQDLFSRTTPCLAPLVIEELLQSIY